MSVIVSICNNTHTYALLDRLVMENPSSAPGAEQTQNNFDIYSKKSANVPDMVVSQMYDVMIDVRTRLGGFIYV